LFLEAFEATGKPANFQVFANDINEHSIDFARRGVYSVSIANDLTKSRLRQFFSTEDPSHFRVNKRLRDYLVFSVQNLLQDAPFSKMDLVSCRNVLIYFEPEVQQRLITLLHFSLNENAYLILGPSETLGQDEVRFESIDKKWRVFRRLGPASAILSSLSVVRHFSPTAVLQTIPITTPRKTYKELAESLVLNEYAPASALINPSHEILNVTGPLIDFLEFPSGEMTKNLLSMARPGLRSKLRAACYQAKLEAKEVTIDHARVRRDGRNYHCSITVRPIRNLKLLEGCMLVLFQDTQSMSMPVVQSFPSRSDRDSTDSSMESTESSVIDLLEAELKATREELQNSAEQTRSFIEELQSSNEELESSKEELQSLNEELNTVNAQLLEKVSELDRSNDELTNVMASTEIATLFLDKLLRIKRVTRPATALFHPVTLKENELLSAVQSPFIQPMMIDDCNAVLAKAEPREEEILAEDGRCFLRRVSPFRIGGNKSEGVVITFVDISERKRHESDQREQDARFREIYNNVASGIVITKSNGEIEQCNAAYCDILGYSEHDLEGMQLISLVHPDDQDREKEGIHKLMIGKKSSFEIENRYLQRDGNAIWVSKFFSLLPVTRGESPKMVALITDISERVNSVRELRHSEEENRAILAALSSQIEVIDRNGVIVATNPAWDRIDKKSNDGLNRSGIGTNYFEVLDSVLGRSDSTNNSAKVVSGVKDVLSGKIDGFRIEYPYHIHNTKSWFLLQATPLQHDRGGAVISHQDITDRVLSELKLKENQEVLQLVMNTVPHYIYAKDKQGVFLFVNQYTAVQCGCASPSEMVGPCEPGSATAKAQSLLFSQTDSEVIDSGIPIFNMEEVVFDWNGNKHFVQTSKQQFKLPSSKEPVVLSVSIDITERKIAETKTHETNERLDAILNTASDAIITIDHRGIIDHANKATESMFGYSLDELLGKNVSILMPPPFRDEHDRYIQRFLKTGEGRIIGVGREIVCRRKDGSIFPADLAISQVDHTGLFTGILRDISSRKEMQKYALELAANEQRRIGLELHDGTQQELTGLTLYANAMIETIEGKAAKQSGIAADGLAHWQFTDTDYRQMQSTARLMALRLREANNHVRDLAHGIMPVQIDTEGLRSALSELAGSMDSVQLKCHVAFQGDLNLIHNTTATHLYRIAQEAVNNAIHHGAASEIWISLAQQGERITMDVADNGIGIEAASLANGDVSKRGMGMRTMDYRASLIGGVIQILQRPEGGTMMRCLILHEVRSHD
jgi:PAS domain S-box-containing protein